MLGIDGGIGSAPAIRTVLVRDLQGELTRRQAQLGKAESQRDRLLAQNRKLRKLIEDNGVKLPARLRWPD